MKVNAQVIRFYQNLENITDYQRTEIITHLCNHMKQVQTFKFDPDLIKDLNTEAKDFDTPFNRYVETLLRNHPYRIKRNITHPERKKK